MMDNEPGWHYLTATDRTTVPRRHVFLAADGIQRQEGAVFVRRWGAAVAVYRGAPKGRPVTEHRRGYSEVRDLWADVDRWCRPRMRTVLWAWDLSVVLRLTQAFTWLPRAGWSITAWSVMPQGTWLVWQNGNRTLTMVDAQSFIPADWPTLAAHFWDPRHSEDPLYAHGSVGQRDVVRQSFTVHAAMVAYLAWIERDQLGGWQLTGAGQGFSAFRHRFLTHRMLVHWDMDARAAERRAMWAGRTEAYWHGTLRRDAVQEWDLIQAYPRICLRGELPVELARTLRPEED